jgi:hypothetical protein
VAPEPSTIPKQTPLYHAEHSGRYERQQLIDEYGSLYGCRLIVMVDSIFWPSVTWFEELLGDADPAQDMHLMLHTFGGDGETAVRLVRAAQSRCKELTVLIPDMAKSAGTLLAMGAHHILMGPTSDLGPVDPQFEMPDGRLVAAKDIIAAVDDATQKVQEAPDTYPVHASLLSDITAIMVQQARTALGRTTDLMEEALKSCPDRTEQQRAELKVSLRKLLITDAKAHAAIFGGQDAKASGLPVTIADPASEQWQRVWRLWAKYFALWPVRVYEGDKASVVHRLTPFNPE